VLQTSIKSSKMTVNEPQ